MEPASNRFSRRLLLQTGLACAMVGANPVFASTLPATRHFQILRKGAVIGEHKIGFERKGNGFLVTSETDIKVKVAFITAFQFRQTAVDVWENGVLTKSRAHTNKDGTTNYVELMREANGMLVKGPNGAVLLDKTALSDTSFWNIDIVKQQSLIRTSDGAVVTMKSRFQGTETIDVAGNAIKADCYYIERSDDRSGKIWFDKNNHWVKADAKASGTEVQYRLSI